jgi:hypothetical protein
MKMPADSAVLMAIELAEGSTGRPLGTLEVGPVQLLPLAAELVRESFTRRGIKAEITDLEFVLMPAPEASHGSAVLMGARPHGTTEPHSTRVFTLSAFGDPVVDYCTKQIATGAASADTQVRFELCVPSSAPVPVDFRAYKGPSPKYHGAVEYALRRLLSASPDEDFHFPVIYTRQAFCQSEKASRAGHRSVPPAETGCWLLGYIVGDSTGPECGAIITQVLRIQNADSRMFSLALTADSWKQIEEHLSQRSLLRILGVAHGHNFDPSTDGRRCHACRKSANCELHTAVLSEEDRRWMRAVFPVHRHPFAVAHVFGLDPAGGCRDQLYTVHDGRLQPRDYRVMDLPENFPNHVDEKVES